MPAQQKRPTKKQSKQMMALLKKLYPNQKVKLKYARRLLVSPDLQAKVMRDVVRHDAALAQSSPQTQLSEIYTVGNAS